MFPSSAASSRGADVRARRALHTAFSRALRLSPDRPDQSGQTRQHGGYSEQDGGINDKHERLLQLIVPYLFHCRKVKNSPERARVLRLRGCSRGRCCATACARSLCIVVRGECALHRRGLTWLSDRLERKQRHRHDFGLSDIGRAPGASSRPSPFFHHLRQNNPHVRPSLLRQSDSMAAPIRRT